MFDIFVSSFLTHEELEILRYRRFDPNTKIQEIPTKSPKYQNVADFVTMRGVTSKIEKIESCRYMEWYINTKHSKSKVNDYPTCEIYIFNIASSLVISADGHG